MITAGAIPALDLYRNQPVVGGYGTHDLGPNRGNLPGYMIFFNPSKKTLVHNQLLKTKYVGVGVEKEL